MELTKKISGFSLDLPLTSFDQSKYGSKAGDHRSTEDWQLQIPTKKSKKTFASSSSKTKRKEMPS